MTCAFPVSFDEAKLALWWVALQGFQNHRDKECTVDIFLVISTDRRKWRNLLSVDADLSTTLEVTKTGLHSSARPCELLKFRLAREFTETLQVGFENFGLTCAFTETLQVGFEDLG